MVVTVEGTISELQFLSEKFVDPQGCETLQINLVMASLLKFWDGTSAGCC